MRTEYKTLDAIVEGKRPLGRPRNKEENNAILVREINLM
jgi:hypothetical protein